MGGPTVAAIDPEEFYDFQVNRPVIGTDDHGHRRLTWPSTQIAIASPPELDRDVILVRGIEPNMRWRQFCAELLATCDELGGELVVTLGALLADTPHTRPIPVTGTATEPDLVDRLKLEHSTYEGPTGIVGVFQDACERLDIPAVSYWAAVPHYVAQPPCPKATLALLGQLEDLLEVSIPLGDLPEDARAWSAWTSSPRRTRTSPTTCVPSRRPGHHRPARGVGRRDRAGVRAPPEAPGRRPRPHLTCHFLLWKTA